MSLTVYKNAELIPIAQDGLLSGYDLFVERGIITRIAPASREVHFGMEEIDCTGKYIVPGLIDAHFQILPGWENNLKSFVAHGVTSARNMWGNQPANLDSPEIDSFKIRQAVAAGTIVGPTLVNTSRTLDGVPPLKVCSRNVNTISDAMLFIHEALNEGATQLKIDQQIIPEVWDALYGLGEEHGLHIVGLVPNKCLAEDFFSKAHSVEHTGSFLLADIHALHRSNCYFVPTLVREKKHDFAQAKQKVERYVSLGGIPAVGTNSPELEVAPGAALHVELALLDQCGLTNPQLLFAATRQGAQVLEIEDKKGTLEIGKDADLLVLSANPLVDIRNLQSIEAVILLGKHFDRSALDAMIVGEKSYAQEDVI